MNHIFIVLIIEKEDKELTVFKMAVEQIRVETSAKTEHNKIKKKHIKYEWKTKKKRLVVFINISLKI